MTLAEDTMAILRTSSAAGLVEIIDVEDGVTGVLETAQHIHFIGIGGVGMSALAELLHHGSCTLPRCAHTSPLPT